MTDAFRRTDAFRKFDNTQYNFHLSVVYEDYRKRLIYVLCMLTYNYIYIYIYIYIDFIIMSRADG